MHYVFIVMAIYNDGQLTDDDLSILSPGVKNEIVEVENGGD